MKFKMAIFDMDGTLIDSLGVWKILWQKIGEEFLGKKDFTPTEYDDKLVRTMLLNDAMDLIHNNYKICSSGNELLDFANDIMKWFYSEVVCVKDGVIDYLKYLKSNGIKMCLVTATAKELVNLALKNCELVDYFPEIISCADIGKGKDELDAFFAACDLFGVKSKDVCVFEDSLLAIETVKKASFQTVGIYDKNNFCQDKIKEISDIYISCDKTLKDLIDY